MTLHDPFAGPDREAARRSRLSRLRKLRHRSRSRDTGQPGAAGPVRECDRRHLAAIDRRLAAETPRLESMFTMFNQLAKDEGPVRAEQLPSAARRPRPAYLVLLVALAAVAAVCYVLSTQIHAAVRVCPAAPVAAATAQLPVHATSCPAYATTSK